MILFCPVSLAGIVTGAVAQKFGPRNCGVIGGIFFCVGLIVSVFATSTIYLQLSYGILSGKTTSIALPTTILS